MGSIVKFRVVIVASVLLAWVACTPGAAHAAGAAPSLVIESVQGPTNLAPGDTAKYAIFVYDKGAAPTSGTLTLSDVLPSGVTLTTKPISQGWTCSGAAGDAEFTCTTSSAVYADGVAAGIEARVDVPAGAVEGSKLTNLASVSGGGSSSASTRDTATVSSQQAPFGVQSLIAEENGEDGSLYTQAGGHPYAATASFRFNTDQFGSEIHPPGDLKDVEVELPPGLIGNPQATPRCASFGHCPLASQVGVVFLHLKSFSGASGALEGQPVFNMVPPKGVVAEFKFPTLSPVITVDARVRSNGDYGITVYSEDLSEIYYVDGATFTFWGTPAATSHDAERKAQATISPTSNPSNSPEIPFFSNPTDCAAEAHEPPMTRIRADSWQHPGEFLETSYQAPPVTDCNLLGFEPQISFAPQTTQAGQPTGYGFDLTIPQSEAIGGLATPQLENTTVSLPAGMGVSPSATGGLTACSSQQIALHSLSVGECPLSSQLGTVQIWTPLLTTQPTLQLTGVREGELECAQGSWTGEEAGRPLQYRWLRDGEAIAGAEASAYLPGAADQGKAIQCEVIASNAGGSTVAITRGETIAPYPSPLPPQNILLPRVEGASTPGSADACIPSSWGGEPTGYAYQWLRGGAPIAGADTSTYTLSAADGGKTVQCEVIATNAGGSALAVSLAAGTVSPSPATTPPLIEAPLTGRVYLAEPECSPCTATQVAEGKLAGLYIEAEGEGVRVKLPGSVAIDPADGQLTAHFEENPQLPFEELQLDFKSGPRAPLANPQHCGAYTAGSDLTSWSSPDLGDATPSSSFQVSFDGAGGTCPASLPFDPSFTAGTVSPQAAGFSGFEVTFQHPRPANEAEERSEQDFDGVQVQTPPGLLGMVSKVALCGEPQASQGTCGAESQIGTTTVSAGPGLDPLQLHGQVYLTSGYRGAPYGLSIVVPAEAGPFKLAGTTGLGTVVVRAAIDINPETAALTITSDPLPRIVDGVILRLRQAHIDIDRPGFILNATDCQQQAISATLTGAEGAEQHISAPYGASGCANLAFNPAFKVSTSAHTSKADGASLTVNIAYPHSGEANIRYVKVELPEQLPSRLTTLQKACLAATFEANPASCPAASIVGRVKASTPVLPVPLEGPVYFVSHGGEAFPSLIVVLQGDGVRIDLTGATFISKAGITSSTFKTVPDAPVSAFQLTLPEGPYSALAANGNLCAPTKTVTVKEKVTRKVHGHRKRVTVKVKKQAPETLSMPTTIEGQNGKVVKQDTKIAVTGCPKAKAVKAKTGKRAKTKKKATKSDRRGK